MDTSSNWFITTFLFLFIAIMGIAIAFVTGATPPDGWGLIVWVAGVTGFVTGLLIE